MQSSFAQWQERISVVLQVTVLCASAFRSTAILPVYSPLSQALVIHCQGSVIGSPWLMLWERILNEAAGAQSRAVVIRPDQVIQWFLAFLPPPRPGLSLNFIFPPPQFCTYTAHFLSCLFYYLFPQTTLIYPPHPPCLHPWSLAKVPKASLDFFFNLPTLPLTPGASSGFADISQIWQSLNHGNHSGKWE